MNRRPIVWIVLILTISGFIGYRIDPHGYIEWLWGAITGLTTLLVAQVSYQHHQP